MLSLYFMAVWQCTKPHSAFNMENIFGFSFCAIFFLHYLLKVLAGIVSWYAKSTIEQSILITVSLVTLGRGDDGLIPYACAGAALVYIGYIMFDEDFLTESPHLVIHW